MTHHDSEPTTPTSALELLIEHGFDGMAAAIETLLNEAMKLERSGFLGARPFERTDHRRGYANGYKPKRFKSRLGQLDLDIPKVRGLRDGSEPFYPKALERGERSERALKLAVAEMYVQGVSTRKVTEMNPRSLSVPWTFDGERVKHLENQVIRGPKSGAASEGYDSRSKDADERILILSGNPF